MRQFSTCATCGDILQVTWVGQLTHPTCKQTDEEVKLRAFVDAAQRGDDKAADKLASELNESAPAVSLGSAALWYASVGWKVFPCAVGGKLPAIPSAHRKGDPLEGRCQGECGQLGHGLYDATSDPNLIKQWWSTRDYNIGIRTGLTFDVIDQDGPVGVKTLAMWSDEGSLPDVHGKVSTTREDGGMHLYILPTGAGNKARMDKHENPPGGIDYRGQGGYVLAPPSIVDGKRYTWMSKPSPEIMGRAHAQAS
ncbi:polymerase primase [Mycobacterium phage Gaia]|uniref:Polymerase primase n=1 Tax=Mycobacterium phage Gaia TaxID=1486472 RepID=A0A068F3J2_9CAUD|nr:DNA polymerase/primase [Mycobacterium phage Gaia]AID58913.1 polymerase primase [Mycobacterium phage Gaia]